MTTVSHPRIVPGKVEERRYQVAMAKECADVNSLIILPTGLGKTIVALLTAADVLDNGGRILILAPTKPLVDQHTSTMSSLLVGAKVAVMNGNMKPEKRRLMMEENDVVVSTPQCVSNDLENGRYGLDGVGLLIYDEAHRATGNYAYVTVASHYTGHAIGMTASPGSDVKRIEEVCVNLGLRRIDLRSEDDPDVAPYVHDIYVNRIEVNMPQELTDVTSLLRGMLDHYVTEMRQLGLLEPNWPASTKHMLVVGQNLQRRLANGQKTAIVFRGLSLQAICMKLLHAISLAETQGMSALRSYMLKLDEDGRAAKASKGAKELVARQEYLDAWAIVKDTKVEHPKVSRVMSLVSRTISQDPGSKVMVFSQYRDTCDLLVSKLSGIEGAKVGKLIGQSNGGLRQKEQIDLLDRFRDGTYNVIVSTSVGEEGLDITSTDAVIFYEPVPSEIRTIQRRGRTGRKNDGEVYVLIAKGTMDEVFENSSKKKEEQMRSHLEKLNKELSKGTVGPSVGTQRRIGEFR